MIEGKILTARGAGLGRHIAHGAPELSKGSEPLQPVMHTAPGCCSWHVRAFFRFGILALEVRGVENGRSSILAPSSANRTVLRARIASKYCHDLVVGRTHSWSLAHHAFRGFGAHELRAEAGDAFDQGDLRSRVDSSHVAITLSRLASCFGDFG